MPIQPTFHQQDKRDDLDIVPFRPCWRCGHQFSRGDIMCPKCGSNQKNIINTAVPDCRFTQIPSRATLSARALRIPVGGRPIETPIRG
ncbi:MAG: hypothetical protein DRH97_06535 [Chloroflexi bacterium]|nr:MAG: hypothetical protein DRH97_06535 [Chloroflexota bacterium]